MTEQRHDTCRYFQPGSTENDGESQCRWAITQTVSDEFERVAWPVSANDGKLCLFWLASEESQTSPMENDNGH